MLGVSGYLPVGSTVVSVNDVHEHFVKPFPTSKTRQKIFDQWLVHRAALARIITFDRQWVDGSYATAKTDPGDIDVVTFLDGDVVNSLPAGDQAILRDLASGHSTRDRWGVDSFVVLTYPREHAQYRFAKRAEGTWQITWTSVKGNANLAKGFLEVRS